MLYIDPSVTTYIIQFGAIVVLFGGGGLIAFLIYLHDKKSRKNNNYQSNYPPSYPPTNQSVNKDDYALKKDVYTKEEVEKIIDEKLKEMGRDKEGE